MMALLAVGLTTAEIVIASDSLSYSGRLVNANGSPVVGPVDLKFELAYSGNTSAILCSQDLAGVSLTNGVFHAKLEMVCGTSLNEVLASVPTGQEAVIRITNTTPTPDKVYSFQALYSVPSAQVAHGLSKLNANNNEVLTWTGSRWEPKPITGATGGTVTSVAAGTGLLGGTITNTGTLSVDVGTGAGKIPQLDGSGKLATSVETDPSVQSFAKSALPTCGMGQVLKSNGTAFSCVMDVDTDTTLVADGSTLFTSGLTIGVKAQGLLDTHLSGISSSCGVNQILMTNGLGSFACADKQWGESLGNLFFSTGSVTIGGTAPASSAILDLQSTTKGFLPPRMTTAQRNGLAATVGLMVYDTTENALFIFDGTQWIFASDSKGGYFRATRSTNQSAANGGTSTTILPNVESIDTENAFDPATGMYTVPRSGFYHFSAIVYWDSINTYGGLTIKANTGAIIGSAFHQLSTGSQLYLNASGSSYLNAGDKVYAYVWQWNSGAANVTYSSLAGFRVGSGGASGGGGGGALTADSVSSGHVVDDSLTVDDVNFASSEGIQFPQLGANPGSGIPGQLYYNSSTNALMFYNGTSWQALGASGVVSANTVDSSKIVDGTVTGSDIASSTITYSNLNLSDGVIPEAKVAGLTAALAGKEPTISAGTTAQYWRGDKSWQTLNTTVVPEGSNLYFLDSRVRNALLSGYGVGSALPLAATDTLIEALGKLEGQIIANDAAFDNSGVWSKNVLDVYYNAGKVGIGTSSPLQTLDVRGAISASGRVYDETGVSFELGIAGKPTSINDGELSISSTGNVGVGTTSPLTPVHVSKDWNGQSSTNVLSAFDSFDDQSRMVLRRANGDPGSESQILTGENLGGIQFRGWTSGGAYTSNSTASITAVAAENYTASAFGTNLQFTTVANGTSTPVARLTISSEGNVGIGTNSPEERLHVVGDIKSESTESYNVIESRTSSETNYSPHFILRRSRGTSSAPTYVQSGDTMGLLTFRNHTGAQGATVYSYATENHTASASGANLMFSTIPNGTNTNTPRMTIDQGGNVGIGITAPTAKFQVVKEAAASAGEVMARFSVSDASGYMAINNNTGADGTISPVMYGLTNSTIGSVGMIGDVSGVDSGTAPAINLQARAGAALTSNRAILSVSNYTTEYVRVDRVGNMGIGDSSPTYKLDVAGDINSTTRLRIAGTQVCTSAGCTASSDRRLKENIRPLDNALDKILMLQGVEYDYKDKAKFGDKHQVGVIAQEVEKIYPEVVITDPKTGMKSVAYDHLVAPLIEAVKGINRSIDSKADREEIEVIKAENQKLKQENAEIKARLERIEKLLIQKAK
ncbi:tail fiber domain-containing protein [Peredibacter starrii]|uniref:Tail fiber domain-containing protein n=1 Tax=Peredibacter starrii TaxID=28202 RepID=A0AAX4HKK4_9BACT|nr:tail fiber domain-containing protein [Peredibacter starrii]WPU63720.1 tail fiber domain-containing protein [Peredibacter starrii]